jgi:hypothetical protein
MDVTDPQDGGPAFPSVMMARDVAIAEGGMSLRDWFAGQALAGLCGNSRDHCPANVSALEAYLLADAMLIARAKGGAA